MGTSTAESRGLFFDNSAWSDFFRVTGYIPYVSSVTGPIRSGIGLVGMVVNAVGIPFFAAIGSTDNRNEAITNLKNSAVWVIRGLVESKPFVGNALMWSIDSLRNRLKGTAFESGTLQECRFFPLVSIVTGTLRSLRGISGAITGIGSNIFFQAKKNLRIADPDIDHKIISSKKFVLESLLEVPQGVIEMIPICDGLCPPLAKIADRIEQKKIDLWKEHRA